MGERDTLPVFMDALRRGRWPDCPTTIPDSAFDSHGKTISRNFIGRNLDQIAARGGMSPEEIWLVTHDRDWDSAVPNIYELVAHIKRLNGLDAFPQNPGTPDAGPSPRVEQGAMPIQEQMG